MFTIYVLKLQQNKYYVGKTKSIQERMLKHFESNGSEWTKRYKPIEILKTYSNCDSFDEEKYTLQTMEKYGIDNVRGGSYCKIELTKSEKIKAFQTIQSYTDRCYRCNQIGHIAFYCPNKNSTNTTISMYNEYHEEYYEDEDEDEYYENENNDDDDFEDEDEHNDCYEDDEY